METHAYREASDVRGFQSRFRSSPLGSERAWSCKFCSLQEAEQVWVIDRQQSRLHTNLAKSALPGECSVTCGFPATLIWPPTDQLGMQICRPILGKPTYPDVQASPQAGELARAKWVSFLG